MSAERWDDLRVDLEAWGAANDSHPMLAPRDALTAVGHHWAKRAGTWGEVKRRALEGESDREQPEVPVEPIPVGHRLRGVSTLLDKDGKAKLQWVKTASEREQAQDVLERLLRELPDVIAARPETIAPPTVPTDSDLLAVYPMGDPHLGMLSWAPETGDSWDLARSEAVHCAAFDHLVERGPRATRALLVPLGDFFHADNASNTTSRSGHALDVDGRYGKILAVGLRLLIHAVDRLLEHHAEVVVDPLTGNHDDHSSLMIGVTLDAYYHNEPRVRVSLSPAIHRYHVFGQTMIGLTHGHTGKLEALGGVMACDRPTEWGATRHRYWLTGHRHHTRRLELAGCVVEVFRTLAPRDAWAAGEGYRSGRDAHRIVYHRAHGEVSRTIVGASYLESMLSEAS